MWSSQDCLMIGMYLGGTKNISAVTSCFTRVHFQVKDLAVVKQERLETLPLVRGILVRGNEVQLVVGIQAGRLCTVCRKHLGM